MPCATPSAMSSTPSCAMAPHRSREHVCVVGAPLAQTPRQGEPTQTRAVALSLAHQRGDAGVALVQRPRRRHLTAGTARRRRRRGVLLLGTRVRVPVEARGQRAARAELEHNPRLLRLALRRLHLRLLHAQARDNQQKARVAALNAARSKITQESTALPPTAVPKESSPAPPPARRRAPRWTSSRTSRKSSCGPRWGGQTSSTAPPRS